jgi:prevent-host-death family protein
MATHITSTQVQQEFGEIMDQAISGSDVIIDRYGNPRVAIIGYRRYKQLLDTERELMRLRLQQASASVSHRADALSEIEIDTLIENARNEANP